jgi:hypothetical protein
MKEKQLKEQLLAELSRRNIDYIVNWAGFETEKIDVLVRFVLLNEPTLSMRAAWALEKITLKFPGILQAWMELFAKNIANYSQSGTRRIMAKLFMLHEIPEAYEGEIIDFCIRMLESADEPVAVKANCMTVIFNLLPKYPELKSEVFAVIEDQLHRNSVGFASRFEVLKKRYKN